MSSVDPSFVERYQLLLEKEPHSKGFAALAEAYRKMGMLDEAESICRKGLKFHPDFASGRVALAKIYMDRQQYEWALQELNSSIESSPENLLAHSLKGETLLEMRRPKEALKAYKMVLLLNPADERAAAAVQQLESLTADEYEEDIFSLEPLSAGFVSLQRQKIQDSPQEPSALLRENDLDRYLSLADAFTIRNAPDKAKQTLIKALQKWGPLPSLEHRLQRLSGESKVVRADNHSSPAAIKSEKILRLTQLLQQITNRRFPG